MFYLSLRHDCAHFLRVLTCFFAAMSSRPTSIKVVRNPKNLRSPKYSSPRRVGERRYSNAHRQGLFQTMSRLSISHNAPTQNTKRLFEQTRTPSPKLPPRRNTIASSNLVKNQLQRKRSPTHLHKEKPRLLVIPETELNL